jgi:hypothetical protein
MQGALGAGDRAQGPPEPSAPSLSLHAGGRIDLHSHPGNARPDGEGVTVRVQKLVDREISSIVGLSWYDGLSYEDLGGDEEKAYAAVFAELLARARATGIKHPVICHAGNGHYSAEDIRRHV